MSSYDLTQADRKLLALLGDPSKELKFCDLSVVMQFQMRKLPKSAFTGSRQDQALL